MSDVLLHLLSLFRLFCFYDVKSSGFRHFKGIASVSFRGSKGFPLITEHKTNLCEHKNFLSSQLVAHTLPFLAAKPLTSLISIRRDIIGQPSAAVQ